MDILMSSLIGLHCILGATGVLQNLNLVESLADRGDIDIRSLVPSLVDESGETTGILVKFKSSKFICASGGTHTLSILCILTIAALTSLLWRSH